MKTKTTNNSKISADVFFQALEKNTSFDPREPNKLLADLGLVIFEKKNPSGVKKILDVLPQGKVLLMKLENKHFADDFLKNLVMANREGQWLAVECLCDPAPAIIQALKQISEDNEFNISHFEGKELFSMKMNQKSRIVFFVENKILEKEVTYPHLINLFGPILRIK